MRILDWYLLKRYLVSFFFTLLVFIPIAIAIDVSEKIDKFISSGLSFFEVVDQYYIAFVIYYSNTFLPLALFISVIMFTSKLAGNTEIVAINSSQISFTRFLLPIFNRIFHRICLRFGDESLYSTQESKTIFEI